MHRPNLTPTDREDLLTVIALLRAWDSHDDDGYNLLARNLNGEQVAALVSLTCMALTMATEDDDPVSTVLDQISGALIKDMMTASEAP